MKTIYSPSISEAKRRFKTVNQTVNKCIKGNITVLSHSYTLTKKGNIYQHLFVIKYPDGTTESIPNERLKGILYIYSQVSK